MNAEKLSKWAHAYEWLLIPIGLLVAVPWIAYLLATKKVKYVRVDPTQDFYDD